MIRACGTRVSRWQRIADHVARNFLEKIRVGSPMKGFGKTVRALLSDGSIVKKSRRKLIVFSTLLAVLSLTSALLMALAPAPLVPDAATSLFAVDEPRSMDAIFQTKVPVPGNRWKYIYIHHSKTASGNALSL